MAGNAPILSQLLSQGQLRPAAKTPSACAVGSSKEESATGQPCWGGSEATSRKRKLSSSGVASDDTNSDSTFHHGVETFLASGCCVIPNVLQMDFVAQCNEKATNDLDFLNEELSQRRREAIASNQEHLLAAVARGDFRELVDRDGERRDVRFQLDRFPFTAPGLIYNPSVYPLVKELLGGGDVNLLYAGVMWALPTDTEKGGESQKWHGDGGHLFSHTHLPPHCINVFYPLVDLTEKNGPTEFIPGTHYLDQFNDESLPRFALTCKAGGAVLFDYRLKHRGGANRTTENRPVLYLAYAKPFFRDAGNIRSGNSLVKSCPSPLWVARILRGEAMDMGKGFDVAPATPAATTNEQDLSQDRKQQQDTATTVDGSGERWVLFRMNIELPDSEEPKILTVHHGDVATEVSSQFCLKNGLGDDFVVVLADTIQQQMDSSLHSQP